MAANNSESNGVSGGISAPTAQSPAPPRDTCARSHPWCTNTPEGDTRQHWFHWHHHHHHSHSHSHGHDRCHHRKGEPWWWSPRWHHGPGDSGRRCGGRDRAAAAGARNVRQPLDDSRWLEDYFSWH